MADPRKQSSSTSSLLHIPEELIDMIVAQLSAADKMHLMAVCRKAARLTMMTAGTKLRVTMNTKFAGLRKVLDSIPATIHLEIICPSDDDKNAQSKHAKSASAFKMFMGRMRKMHHIQAAVSCRWEGITKVTIEGVLMRCLIPPFIALTCPQLAHLQIVGPLGNRWHNAHLFTGDSASALPLTPSHSLKQLDLEYNGPINPITLPPAHHTPQQLLKYLPNVDTLVMEQPSDALIQAFGAQLTRLELRSKSQLVASLIRRCSNLQHLRVDGFILPKKPALLRVLHLHASCCNDGTVNQLLQVPNLTELHLQGILGITQDYSHQACSWQELHVQHLEFTALGNLNLSNLKKLSMWSEAAMIVLPDASNPNSLMAVQRAYHNLAPVGQIVVDRVNDDVHFGRCGVLAFGIFDSNLDLQQEAVNIFNLAAQRIGPCKACDVYLPSMHTPLILNAIINWGRMFLESVVLKYQPTSELTWQVLQQLHRLSTVVVNVWVPSQYSTPDDKAAYAMDMALQIVRSAAAHYVEPARRKLRLEFQLIAGCVYPEELTTRSQTRLREIMQTATLPGSNLVSIEFCAEACIRECIVEGSRRSRRSWRTKSYLVVVVDSMHQL